MASTFLYQIIAYLKKKMISKLNIKSIISQTHLISGLAGKATKIYNISSDALLLIGISD